MARAKIAPSGLSKPRILYPVAKMVRESGREEAFDTRKRHVLATPATVVCYTTSPLKSSRRRARCSFDFAGRDDAVVQQIIENGK